MGLFNTVSIVAISASAGSPHLSPIPFIVVSMHWAPDSDATKAFAVAKPKSLWQWIWIGILSSFFNSVINSLVFFGGVKVAAYTASKGGVAQLSKALSKKKIKSFPLHGGLRQSKRNTIMKNFIFF